MVIIPSGRQRSTYRIARQKPVLGLEDSKAYGQHSGEIQFRMGRRAQVVVLAKLQVHESPY